MVNQLTATKKIHKTLEIRNVKKKTRENNDLIVTVGTSLLTLKRHCCHLYRYGGCLKFK